ncbi:hypothetical protein L6164_008949 [Bauhinia variegata]|uniref:Uncharacterized protein n=1 Tax=Bauhinia variegata TaxID=167791 RepID=A0ACB9PI41_BAUVA|nr:hypothetical protein L6164_008949 [Bauhinia variegata]
MQFSEATNVNKQVSSSYLLGQSVWSIKLSELNKGCDESGEDSQARPTRMDIKIQLYMFDATIKHQLL